MRLLSVAFLVILAAACSRGPQTDMAFRDVGPEQSTFTVMPAAPLEIPPTNALPQPTPGGPNRATR